MLLTLVLLTQGVFIAVQNVLKKWKNIRGGYAREILRRKSEQKSGSGAKPRRHYLYFEQLRFLETSTKKTSDSMNDSNENVDDIEEQPIDDLESQVNKPDINNKQRKTKNKNKKEDDELIDILKKKIISGTEGDGKKEETDGDKLFLLSLLPEIKLIPQERKLKVRSDILAVIANAQASPSLPQQQWTHQQFNQPPFQLQNNYPFGPHPYNPPQPFHQQQQQQIPFNAPQNINISHHVPKNKPTHCNESALTSPSSGSNSTNLTDLGNWP